jgi:ABC transporter with metal-binding/Fe-S-binding domain ATP-binding protein
MFHFPAVNWSRLQAEATQLPMIMVNTSGEKEVELMDLKRCLTDLKQESQIEGVVSGAISSDYQKTRIDRVCEEVGLKSLAPLWHKDPEALLKEEIEFGFEIVITACQAMGFSKEWLGRRLDLNCLEDIRKIHERYGIHMGFEGGEAETFVLDGPMFKKRIKILDFEVKWETDSGYLLIRNAALAPK